MPIQWFPGHMTKSIRMMEQDIKLVDAVIYVLDARAVSSCINPYFERIINNKKRLYAVNKCDISDQSVNALWQNLFKSQGQAAVLTDGRNKVLTNQIITKLNGLLSQKKIRNSKKGITLPLRAMVIGVPNSGKSTIINTLCKGKRAKTGNKAGVTRGKQWIDIGGIELLDTPGTLWNSFEQQRTGYHLAYIGSIKEEILDAEDVALNLLTELKELYPDLLIQKYGVTGCEDSRIMLDIITRKKGCLVKGGADTLRGAKAVLDDFKKARIGKISLDRP